MGVSDFPIQFLQNYRKNKFYGQTGTDIPTFGLEQNVQGGSGTGIPPYYQEDLVASTPSFDLRYPKMPGIGSENQSIEGIPNASPELIRKFVERKMKNPGGQELPGFLKGV
jgi:hypothetical protein